MRDAARALFEEMNVYGDNYGDNCGYDCGDDSDCVVNTVSHEARPQTPPSKPHEPARKDSTCQLPYVDHDRAPRTRNQKSPDLPRSRSPGVRLPDILFIPTKSAFQIQRHA